MKAFILDDYYPDLSSSFRIAEYNWYLRHFAKWRIFSTGRHFLASHAGFAEVYPDLADRVFHSVDLVEKPDLYYCIFVNNVIDYLGIFEKDNVPFSFTLYPGGGLRLNDPEVDEQLKRIGSSRLFRDVIVTQKTTLEYVREKEFFDERRLHFIYGGTLDSRFFRDNHIPKRRYGKEKDTFDICFIAFRYDPRGVSKGYDIFLEVARELMGYHSDIRFHLVGNTWWDVIDEMDTSFLEGRLTDHGVLPTSAFPEFHSGMDMMLSPNRPFCHPAFPGSFDGFPTACCMEAGMCGTPVLCTDLLGDNIAFKDGRDIRIIPYDIEGICDIVTCYFEDLDALYELGENCRESFLRVLDLESQMEARCRALGFCAEELNFRE